ncbi:MAG: hypothetical protein QOD81_778 [Solirubrobacteraceae bacterium]|nr:hypothetical protein [Solirubrobacteraceae bacterium]
MTLIVDAPPTYEAERRYALQVVVGEWLGLEWELRSQPGAHVRFTVQDAGPGSVILPDVLFATDERDWLMPPSLPPRPLRWRPVTATRARAATPARLPVVYGDAGGGAALVSGDGPVVRLGIDVLGTAFFMLTRYEEAVVTARDAFARFPAGASIAAREGFLGVPLLDAYLEVLWSALQRLWPRLARRRRRFQVALTHDVDRPLAFLGRRVPALVRQLAADALVRRDAALAAQRVRSWAAIPRGDYRLDPYNTFDFLMDVSERHAITSAFYFMASEHASVENGFYTLGHPWIRSLMTRIHRRGQEIGFHAGFHTYRDSHRTAQEFTRLRAAAEQLGIERDRWGGRQHYLQWHNPPTWANWERAGLDYDSTLGFADRVGFRVGTCHEFPTFDLGERRMLKVRERPLHVMDGTLFEYMRLSPDAAADAVLDLARQCRRYEGTLTLLWHNSFVPTATGRDWYASMVGAVTAPIAPV